MNGRWITLAVAVLAALHAATFLGSGPVDDDFICYRYARNLVEGHGLVYEPGERVEGFTNPLWVLCLAAAMALSIDPVTASLSLSITGLAVAAWAAGDAWRARYPDAVWPVPALLFAASPCAAWHAVAGLGTTLLAALVALWWRAWDAARREGRAPLAAGCWLALACLVRQECAIFAAAFVACEARGRGRRAALLPVIALAGWTAFRLVYYGRLLPIPYHVKKLPLAADLGYGLRYLGLATLQCGIGILVLAGLGAAKGLPGARAAAARAAAWAVLAHALYVVAVGGDFMELSRFFVPVLPLALLLASAALRERTRPGAARVALVAAGLVLPQWTQLGWTLHGRKYRFLDHEYFEERWAALGRHFRAATAPGSSVALSPIGAFGYHSRRPIVDILGLTTDALVDVEPDLEHVGMKGHHRFDPDWVLAQRPDYVILGNGVRDLAGVLHVNPWEASLFQHPRFQRDYVHMIAPVPDGAPLDVFQRRDASPLPGARPAPLWR